MSERGARLADNLWRWTTPYPLWREGDDKETGGRRHDVGSLLYEGDGTATIFDPEAGEEDPAPWACFVAHARVDEGVVVALTASWQLRSTREVIERYGGEIRRHRTAAGDTAMQDVADVRPFDEDGESGRCPAQADACTSAAASSARPSCSRTSPSPLFQNPGSARSRPAIAASSSGLREPPALRSSM
jgi:hypothetical protein